MSRRRGTPALQQVAPAPRKALAKPLGRPDPTSGMPWPGFGAEIAAHGRVGHLHCDLCTRLDRIQAESERFLRVYGMTDEDMVDGV